MSNLTLLVAVFIFLFAINILNAIKEHQIRKGFNETLVKQSEQETERIKLLVEIVRLRNEQNN